MKKSGSEAAARPLRSPISLYFARFSLKMQEKTSLALVDKRGFFYGGRGWIRTTEVDDNRFTVCPLWPLGNSSVFTSLRLEKTGAGGRIRTPDLLITNQLLYQLSYTSVSTLD